MAIDWRPIVTAPRDGTGVLLRGVDSYRIDQESGRVVREVEWFEIGSWGPTLSDEEGWTEDCDLTPLDPTHWAPLVGPVE